MTIFRYDTKKLQKHLLQRTLFVLSCVALFLVWSLYPLPGHERWEFFRVFAPFLGLLVVLLFWLQKKQVDLVSKGYVEVTENSLRQFDSRGFCSEILFSDCEVLKKDLFRAYPRLILETESRIYPLVNIENFDSFLQLIEEKTKKSVELDLEEDSFFFSKRTFYFLLPSLIFGILCLVPTGVSFFKAEIFNLVINANVVILFLYWKEKENPALPNFSMKRRMLFVALVLFGFQVWNGIGDSLTFSR